MKKQTFQLKTDVRIQIDRAREDLGLNNPNISSKINLYSVDRVVEMILSYLMMHSLYQVEDS